MFRHLFKYKLKVTLKNKAMLFWTLIFPFVLGTFFQLALGNIGSTFEFSPVDIAVIESDEFKENTILKNVIESLSEESSSQVFNTKYTELTEAEELLEDGKISGIIIVEDKNPKLIIRNNGINETIIKYALDEYYSMSNVVSDIIEYNPESIKKGILDKLQSDDGYIKDNTTENIDFTVNYFYTLIAMTCLYGSLIGVELIKDNEANLSKKGARVCVSPANKFKLLLAGLLSSYILELIVQVLLFLYLKYVLDVSFGANTLAIFIISAVGCLAGLSLGTFIGASNKKNESFKIGLLLSVIMACCFFAGMMGDPSLKATLADNLPFIKMINPISIITDGIYALFAYDNLDVYYICLAKIAIFHVITMILTFIFVRRKCYDSI